jgi:DMSO/TMAO reductase YedYZ molybdopterin-dependent catalytic subunit
LHNADEERAMTEHARRRLDLVDGKAWVAFAIDGQPPENEHAGPTRLLVPHLYFWKSAGQMRDEISLLKLARPP